jgi:hypothetical protein
MSNVHLKQGPYQLHHVLLICTGLYSRLYLFPGQRNINTSVSVSYSCIPRTFSLYFLEDTNCNSEFVSGWKKKVSKFREWVFLTILQDAYFKNQVTVVANSKNGGSALHYGVYATLKCALCDFILLFGFKIHLLLLEFFDGQLKFTFFSSLKVLS